MKGILKNTKAGWFVLYQVMRDEITSGYDSIPLHPDSQTWMDGYNLYEGREVEFEVRVYPSGARYAKTIQGQVVLDDETLLVADGFHQGVKQTAVEQLIYDIKNIDMSIFNEHHCQRYLDLEKEQIVNTFKDAQVLYVMNDQMRGEQYYNKNYGK
jgi:hypothetical protein